MSESHQLPQLQGAFNLNVVTHWNTYKRVIVADSYDFLLPFHETVINVIVF